MRYHFACYGYTHSNIVRNDRDKEKRLKNGDKNDMDRNYSVILVRHYIDAKEATRSVTFWKRHHVVYSMTFVVHE